jgi:HD superfamily phosphohydrolase
LGTLQSACDTLSYLLLDLSETGRDRLFTSADAQHVLQTIQGVREHNGEQVLVVSDTQPWQKLLEVRATMYREVYHSFEARVADKALALLLSHAAEKNLIDESTIIQGSDRELVLALHSFVHGPSSLREPALPKDEPLFSLAMGQYSNTEWTQTTYDTQEEAQAHISDTAFIEPTHTVPRKKKLKLLIAGTDTPVTLTAQEHQETEPMRWVVLKPIHKESSSHLGT